MLDAEFADLGKRVGGIANEAAETFTADWAELTNLQKDNQPLLQIFLVGQEELRQTVLAPGRTQCAPTKPKRAQDQPAFSTSSKNGRSGSPSAS